MKKLFAVLAALSVAGQAFAFTETREINTSTFCATNVTTFNVPATAPNTDLRSVIIGSGSIGGVLTIYDSSATATNPLAIVSLNSAREMHFNVRLSSGLTYTTSSNTNGVTILYHIN